MPQLHFEPALTRHDLLAPPVSDAISRLDDSDAAQIQVAAIDGDLADTAAFCEAYDIPLDISANCIVVAGKRGDTVTYAACVVLATTRADVNGKVRHLLGSRKASFAPMDDAVRLTGMEYGGITPIGLPTDWSLLIDSRVATLSETIVGAGIRAAKIGVPGTVLAAQPDAQVIEGLANEISATG